MSLLSRAVSLIGPERIARALGMPSPETIERARKQWGGQLAPPPVSVLEWFQDDIHSAIRAADTGDMMLPGQLCRALRRDGMVHGLLRARTGGLVRLPKRFTGRKDMTAALEGPEKRRGLFELMWPSAELSKLASDGILLGVGVAEMVPIPGTNIKVMRRLDPQWLRYRWNESRWYFNSIAGALPITPGDGTWILHLAGGVSEPWNGGAWVALGKSFISKDHAFMHEESYAAKLAHPLRVARTAPGSTEQQRLGFLDQLIAWGPNGVVEMPPAWAVELIESKGIGFEAFKQITDRRNDEIALILAGSKVLIDGGAAFSNDAVYKSIRADLTQEDADALAYTLNTQGIPPWANDTYGGDSLDEAPLVEWDVTPEADRKAEAEAQKTAAEAVTAWNVLTGDRVAVDKMAVRYRVPIKGDVDGDGAPDDDAPGVEVAEPGDVDDALVVDDAESTGSAAQESSAQHTDIEVDAKQLGDMAKAVKEMSDGLKAVGLRPTSGSVQKIVEALGVDVEPLPVGDAPAVKLELAPTDVARVVKVDEARRSQGLPPIGDERGQLTIPELDAPPPPQNQTNQQPGVA